MASTIGKRKREVISATSKPIKKVAIQERSAKTSQRKEKPLLKGQEPPSKTSFKVAPFSASGTTDSSQPNDDVHIQIVTGSYERVLHGICASIPRDALDLTSEESPSNNATTDENSVGTSFADTFLFAAHASSIRCLAISPPTDQHSDKRFLATGSSDERINVYSLSTAPPQANAIPALPSLKSTLTAENPRNRSLGSLNHHDRAITCLNFPVRTKLVSAAEDATISVSRTRDWTVLSSIKAPIPKPQGRPSGDTAAPGEVPAGVNDFAIHPSQRLMLSVGRGERCVRLWNMMTGKKAGVLNFDRSLLGQVGEGKFGTGEGRRVLWDGSGEHYVVGFERGTALFGLDSKPQAIIRPSPPTKLHQMRFLPRVSEGGPGILAISSEDGRLLFYNVDNNETSGDGDDLPALICLAQLGGRDTGMSGRIKDFEVLRLPSAEKGPESHLLIVTGNSDGAVRLWVVFDSQLVERSGSSNGASKAGTPQVGRLVGTLETGDRITCLGAFLLDGSSGDRISADAALDGLEDKEPSEESEQSDEE